MVEQEFHISPYVERISNLNLIDARILEKAIEEKPWCSAYRILLARCHENEASFTAEQKLNLASLYTGDREVLFELMNNGERSHTAKEPVHKPAHLQDTASDAEPGTSVFAHLPLEQEKHEPADHDNSKIDAVEDIKEHFRPELEGEVVREQDAVHIDSEEIRDSDEAVKKGFDVDFEAIVTYDPTRDLKPEEKKAEDRVEISFEGIAYNPEMELQKFIDSQKSEAAESADIKEGERDFFYWLDHIKEEMPLKREQPAEVSKVVQSNVDEVSELLDKFLAGKQRMTPKASTFYDPERKARESELDESDLVSESLANLYIRKELYEKAIQTMRKLILQNPSKSAYFAARINEVEHLQNQLNNRKT